MVDRRIPSEQASPRESPGGSSDRRGMIPMESSAGRSLDRLVTQARRGSRSALEHLMESCRPWLRREAAARLPRGLARKHDASDLVQEVQYRGAARFDTFRGQSGGEFRAWMAGILKRLVFQELRFWGEQRRDRRREGPLGPACGAAKTWPGPGPRSSRNSPETRNTNGSSKPRAGAAPTTWRSSPGTWTKAGATRRSPPSWRSPSPRRGSATAGRSVASARPCICWS